MSSNPEFETRGVLVSNMAPIRILLRLKLSSSQGPTVSFWAGMVFEKIAFVPGTKGQIFYSPDMPNVLNKNVLRKHN